LILAASLLAAGWITTHHDAKQPVSSTTPTDQAASAISKQPASQTDQALNNLLTAWAGQQSFHTSIVVQELTGSKRTASFQATDSVVPASTYKIYVAYAVLHGIEQGKYSLTTPTDDGNSIQTDLSNMILNSDNDAARTLGFLYGWKSINSLLTSQGLTGTNLYNYVPPSTQPVGDKHSTAQDLATILNKLSAGSLLNASHTQLLLNLMKQQHYRERVPAGVPSDVAVADKPGWLSPADGEAGYTQNDAAIVYGPKSTYIVVITTTGSSTSPLANLSRQIYNYLET
jgi:beta-lactamase class A